MNQPALLFVTEDQHFVLNLEDLSDLAPLDPIDESPETRIAVERGELNPGFVVTKLSRSSAIIRLSKNDLERLAHFCEITRRRQLSALENV